MKNPSLLWSCSVLAALSASSVAFAQTTTRVSVTTGGAQANSDSAWPAITPSGRFVAFASFATNLVTGDTNGWTDVFVRDLQGPSTEIVSISSSGGTGDFNSEFPSISADGRYIAFESWASNLEPGDSNASDDIYVRDRLAGTTERISVSSLGAEGNWNSRHPSISGDGRYVVFGSIASNLVPGDNNAREDVFLHDRLAGTTVRLSTDAGGTEGNDNSFVPSISTDGRFVTFQSYASNLVPGDTNGHSDIFVRDLVSGTIELVSPGAGATQGNGDSEVPAISADGRFVVFQSLATNLVPGDTNGVRDIFVRDRLNGTTERASVSSGGVQANGVSSDPYEYTAISGDGRFVAFPSLATNLVAGDTNGQEDVFVHDRLTGATERASASTAGAQSNGTSTAVALSGDGRYTLFHSGATNLVAGDTNAVYDVFLRDRAPLVPVGFCFGDGSTGNCPCGNLGLDGRGCENSFSTGGAQLSAAGNASVSADSLVLTSAGELPSASSIFLQSSVQIGPTPFGDGLRCLGGSLRRLYVHAASNGSVSGPITGDLPISARSAQLGDALASGATRYYQVVYRDPTAAYCASPAGGSWNISSGLAVVWGQ